MSRKDLKNSDSLPVTINILSYNLFKLVVLN